MVYVLPPPQITTKLLFIICIGSYLYRDYENTRPNYGLHHYLLKFSYLELEPINSHQNLTLLNNEHETFELTTEVGTERYMAPEMLAKKKYDYKIDIFACGIMFYEMFENKRYIPNTKMQWSKCPKARCQ